MASRLPTAAELRENELRSVRQISTHVHSRPCSGSVQFPPTGDAARQADPVLRRLRRAEIFEPIFKINKKSLTQIANNEIVNTYCG